MEARGTRRSPSFVLKLLLLIEAARRSGPVSLSRSPGQRQRADFPRLGGRAPAAPSLVITKRAPRFGRRSFPSNFVALSFASSSNQHRSPTNTVGGALREDSASARSMPLANNFATASAISVGSLPNFLGLAKVQTTSSAIWGLRCGAQPTSTIIRRFEDDARVRRPGPRGSALYYAAAFSSSRRLR